MLNQVFLIGRVISIDENSIVLKIKKPDNDEITVSIAVGGEVAKSTKEYGKEGDIVGIKGYIDKDAVAAQKITFLTSKED